jgi:Zn-dependent peptidase ImmA (M78 family)
VKRADVKFQGERLRQARLVANMTATQLAERLDVTRQVISAAEKGKSPSLEKITQLAKELSVSVEYFYQPVPADVMLPVSAINYRSLKRTPEFQKSRADAALGWAQEVTSRFSEFIELPKPNLPPALDCVPEAITNEDIEQIARATRQHFGLGFGPIDKLILLLENHGVIVGFADLSDDMDGVSAWYDQGPIILAKRGSPAVRTRFDVAHELGHLMLHRHLVQEDVDDEERHTRMEKQAHQFAAAFLLPEEGFVPEAIRVDLDYLLVLKKRWLVSLQAMMMRLQHLNLLSVNQITRFYQNLNRRNWRKNEPLDDVIPHERPVLLERAGRFLDKERILPFHEAFLRTRLPSNFLEVFAGLDPAQLSPVAGMGTNVIDFRRKPST